MQPHSWKSVPHPVLAASIAQCASHSDRQVSVLCSLRRGREERLTMLTALGELYCGGRNIDWDVLYPSGGTVVKLPAYPWQRERYWIDEQTTRSSTEKPTLRPVQSEPSQPAAPEKLNDWLYQIVWEPKPRQRSKHRRMKDRHISPRRATSSPACGHSEMNWARSTDCRSLGRSGRTWRL